MNQIKARTYILGLAFVVCGGAFYLTRGSTSAPKTEDWMVAQAPDTVAGKPYLPGPEEAHHHLNTYLMDKSTYDVLHPYGIVSRVYEYKGKSYDTVLIASRSKDSFHDPRVCFAGQGFMPDDQQTVLIPTQTSGKVKATFTHLVAGERQAESKFAVFMYKGPGGYMPATNDLKWDMFKHELLKGYSADGVFYRFIALDPRATKDDLFDYIGAFIDAANRSSHGYY